MVILRLSDEDSRRTSTFDLARAAVEEGAGTEIHLPAEGLPDVATFSSKNHLRPVSPGAKQFPSLAYPRQSRATFFSRGDRTYFQTLAEVTPIAEGEAGFCGTAEPV